MLARPQGFDALAQPLLGMHAIEASAGTGKTYSITLLWLRLLTEVGLQIDQILVTTFTRAATAELKERLLTSLRRALQLAKCAHVGSDEPEARIVAAAQARSTRRNLVSELEAALSSFDLAPIHTIHGFCQSLMSRHALELGCDPGLELTDNAYDLLDQIVDDYLMRNADCALLDRASAITVARATAAHPLADLLDAIDAEQVRARSRELLQPTFERILETKLASRTSQAILRKLADLLDTGKRPAFSPAQVELLSPVIGALEPVIQRVVALHMAARAAQLQPIAALARQQLPQRKLAAGLRTFDDILLTVQGALRSQPKPNALAQALHQRLKAAIVDECQDSDAIQIDVFHGLFATADAFLVIGDPKQGIYRFRGADISSYQRLAAGAARAPDMTTNYRSDASLVAALNELYARQPQFRGAATPYPIRYVNVAAHADASRIFDARVNAPLLLLWSDSQVRNLAKHDIARQTAREFQRLLTDSVTIIDRETQLARRLRASDLAVIATTHGDLALIRRELQAAGIPSEQAAMGLGSVFASVEALDVHTWLAAIVALQSRSDGLSAMLAFAATPLLAFSPAQLEALRADPLQQAALARKLAADHEALFYQGPLPLLQRYWSSSEQLEARLGTHEGERRVTNWRHIGGLLQEQWYAGRLHASELLVWLARKRASQEVSLEGTLLKLETDSPAVQLVTVFGAKGLEYPIVCCPFLWSIRSLPQRLQRDIAIVHTPEGTVLDVGSEAFANHLSACIAQEDEEQDRLLYVAMTRARHRLYLGLAPVSAGKQGHGNGAENSALVGLLGLSQTDKSQWLLESGIARLTLDEATDTHTLPVASLAAEDQPRPPPELRTHWSLLTRCSSYSALTRNENATPTDYDPDDAVDVAREPGLLGALKLTGNRLGQRVHALLEDVIGNRRPLDSAVAHLDPEWRTAIESILHTPIALGHERVTLNDVSSRAIAEMHVLLPVTAMTASNLSQAMLLDPLIASNRARRQWAEALADFGFAALAGFFQGYIDLIFEHQGRFHVVDYKTNALASYAPDSIEAAMLHHHYLLQARLYWVALHRHLRATMPEYDPARHLGGCLYLFVRGFPERGVWFEQPSIGALDALDALFTEALA